MSVHPTKLEVKATQAEIDAELHDDLLLDSLFEAEEVWSPERVRFLRDCVRAGVGGGKIPQSIHWNWSLKTIRLPGFKLGPLSAYRLFGIKCDGAWQGLLLGCCVGHTSKVAPVGRELVYIDFVESAPWNWDLAEAGRTGKFKGIGGQLFESAVQWSLDLGFKGRVGLHALPQADSFYRGACGMTDLGPDAHYKSLRYFEFTESQATTYLGED